MAQIPLLLRAAFWHMKLSKLNINISIMLRQLNEVIKCLSSIEEYYFDLVNHCMLVLLATRVVGIKFAS